MNSTKNLTQVLIVSQSDSLFELVSFITNAALSCNNFLISQASDVQKASLDTPTLVLIDVNFETENFTPLLESITPGGILVYDENNRTLEQQLDETTVFFRKIAVTKAITNSIDNGSILETDLGEMMLNFTDSALLDNLNAVKNLCQHLTVQEDEFFELIAEFSPAG